MKLTLSIIEEDKGGINGIVNELRAITPVNVLRMAKFFGFSEDFWMNLQCRWDLYKTKRTELKKMNTLKPLIQKIYEEISTFLRTGSVSS